MSRRPANKRRSHKRFKNRVGKTEALNLKAPRRGGIRL